ncbi:MAG: glycosyltransferase [Bacteroidetes bacterium]|nr:glycosyltransferase [Bacteroidota bacterium]
MKRSVSIISPVYKAGKIVDELVRRVSEEASRISDSYEIILVEDCGGDNSWEKIVENCELNPAVRGIKLSRNFGQHYAITAGMMEAKGDIVIIMDCDLQDDPVYFTDLLKVFDEGYDIVFTKRINRKHSLFKKITAGIYNFLFRLFADKNFDLDVGSMTMISSRVKDEFVKLKDQDRLYIQLLKWIGFRSAYLPVEHKKRFEGRSSYTLSKLFFTAIQGWTSHSDKLLRLSIYSGLFISFVTLLIGIYIVISYFMKSFQAGWPSLIVAVLFSAGLILMSIGITGIYIGKIFEQTKERPLYIIDKKINF